MNSDNEIPTQPATKYEYKVTGVDRKGKRFKPLHTESWRYAYGINMYRGTVWEREQGTTKWTRIREVWNWN